MSDTDDSGERVGGERRAGRATDRPAARATQTTDQRTEGNDTERTDGGAPTATPGRPFGLPTWVTAVAPLALLGVLIAVFVTVPLFQGVQSGSPLPSLTVSHVTLPNDETLVLHVTNNGPQALTVQQVLVDEAYWNFQMFVGGQQTTTIGAMQSGRVVIPYHWTPGWDLETTLVVDGGATFHHTIVAPQPTPGMTAGVLGTLAIVGVLVGVVPVALGMLWFPAMRTLGQRWIHATLLFAAGVLAFLAFDAGFEALEIAHSVPGAFEGELLVVVGAASALLLVQAVSARGSRDGELSGLHLAYMVALGIGLHNLAEGLAIGSAFALGRVSLGAFLVLGFMIHNVTEGPAVVAPVSRGDRPPLKHFAALGLLAGAPIILGGWIGGFAFSPTLGAFFLAVGVGTILQVVYEIAGMVRRQGRLGTATNLLAFLVGLVVMYATDLLVAL